jgi:membrane protein
VSAISGRFESLQMVGPVIYVGLKMLPFALIWILFTLVYVIMPNTRVHFDAALLAGVIAGSAYQAIQATYIHFQIVVAKYNAIYGSFAALPLFLLWLQISWLIVIIGAEISHAYQRSEYMDLTPDGRKMSLAETQLVSLAICRHVIRLFHQDRPAQHPEQIAHALALPLAMVDSLTDLLIKANILVRLDGDSNGPSAVQPARDIHKLTVNTVLAALADAGGNRQRLAQVPDADSLTQALMALRHELDRSAANRLILEL